MTRLRRLRKMCLMPVLLALAVSVLPELATSGTVTVAAATSHSGLYVQLSGHVQFSDGYDATDATVYILPYGATDSNYAWETVYTDENGDFSTTNGFRINRSYTIEVDTTDAYGTDYTNYFNITIPRWARGAQTLHTLTFDTSYY